MVLEAANGRLAVDGRSFSIFRPRKSRLKKIMEEVIKLEKIMTAPRQLLFCRPGWLLLYARGHPQTPSRPP